MASFTTEVLSALASAITPADTDLLPAGTGSGSILNKLTWANLIVAIKSALGIETINNAITGKFALASITTLTINAGLATSDSSMLRAKE